MIDIIIFIFPRKKVCISSILFCRSRAFKKSINTGDVFHLKTAKCASEQAKETGREGRR